MFARMLVPIDVEHEDSWKKVLPAAAAIAKAQGAELHVLYVVPAFGSALVGSFFPEDFETKVIAHAKERLAQIVSGADLAGVAAKMHVAHGTIYEEVMRAADSIGADLIVLGTPRPEHEHFHLGPNCAQVARHARQSTLVLRV